jgi:hypothetical protein
VTRNCRRYFDQEITTTLTAPALDDEERVGIRINEWRERERERERLNDLR